MRTVSIHREALSKEFPVTNSLLAILTQDNIDTGDENAKRDYLEMIDIALAQSLSLLPVKSITQRVEYLY